MAEAIQDHRQQRNKVTTSELASRFVYFFSLLALSLYVGWTPHEIYLGYCIESANLILIGTILLGVQTARSKERNSKQILHLLCAVLFLWFPFLFSTATSGILELSQVDASYQHKPQDFFLQYPKYLPWIILNILLALQFKQDLNIGSEILFSKAVFLTLRLFPLVVVALILAALPASLTIKVITFHTLLAFPYLPLYRYLEAPEENEHKTEARLSFYSFGVYLAFLFLLPLIAMPVGLVGFGIWLGIQGQTAGFLFALIGAILLWGILLGLRVAWKRFHGGVKQ